MDIVEEGRRPKNLSTALCLAINGVRIVIPGLEQVIHSLPGVIHYSGGIGSGSIGPPPWQDSSMGRGQDGAGNVRRADRSGENGFLDGEDVLAEVVVLVDLAVDFAGPVDDRGVVPVAQQASHLGWG